MNNPLKEIPSFENEAEEALFWATHDSTEYMDWSQAKKVKLPHLRPSTERITLRLPKELLDHIKLQAQKRDMPYQTLIKDFLYEAAQIK